jgi:signal transduction histidine kinase
MQSHSRNPESALPIRTSGPEKLDDPRCLEKENEGLREQLRFALRQASMAEVATGAIHNVGNVLNSINVSVSLVVNGLRQSRLPNLNKALALLREHRQDLGSFLANDPKGTMLPGYLETLAEHLTAEYADVLREAESLARNLEHVKEIVAVQQSYSQQCGATETIQISELVQDAVRMNLGAFERHGITIKRDFAEVPPVAVDKHKALQILINLMRNAKYAIDELGPPQKVITLSIQRSPEGWVKVAVQDNGIGIAKENLGRVFDHGFTTKRDGHGFGLHSGLLAAREMGGQLTVHSEGIGTGAVFCLALPSAEVEGAPNRYARTNTCS